MIVTYDSFNTKFKTLKILKYYYQVELKTIDLPLSITRWDKYNQCP